MRLETKNCPSRSASAMSYIKLRDGIRGRVPKWGEVCPCGEGACLAPRYARLSWHYIKQEKRHLAVANRTNFDGPKDPPEAIWRRKFQLKTRVKGLRVLSLSGNMSWRSVLGQRIASRHGGSNPTVGEKRLVVLRRLLRSSRKSPRGLGNPHKLVRWV